MYIQELMQDWKVQKVKFPGQLKQGQNCFFMPLPACFSNLALGYSDFILFLHTIPQSHSQLNPKLCHTVSEQCEEAALACIECLGSGTVSPPCRGPQGYMGYGPGVLRNQ